MLGWYFYNILYIFSINADAWIYSVHMLFATII
eukprot:COSAG06_NODE_43496_length_371_cov_1.147059_1_plen_32_part_01